MRTNYKITTRSSKIARLLYVRKIGLGRARKRFLSTYAPPPTPRLSRRVAGSCNGLQHYAALGLDAKGGAQVNLVPSSKPQDVYTGVCDVVKKEVSEGVSSLAEAVHTLFEIDIG